MASVHEALFNIQIDGEGQFVEVQVGNVLVVIKRGDDGVSVDFQNAEGEVVAESWVTFAEAALEGEE